MGTGLGGNVTSPKRAGPFGVACAANLRNDTSCRSTEKRNCTHALAFRCRWSPRVWNVRLGASCCPRSDLYSWLRLLPFCMCVFGIHTNTDQWHQMSLSLSSASSSSSSSVFQCLSCFFRVQNEHTPVSVPHSECGQSRCGFLRHLHHYQVRDQRFVPLASWE